MRSHPRESLPTIAIVGRPNVGKSSLFNRLIGRRKAIVDPTPGVTRDRIEASMEWGGKFLRWIDTGGMDFDRGITLKEAIQRQVDCALEQADVVLFLVDAQEGLVPLDREIMAKIRRLNKPILVAANKCDVSRTEQELPVFYELGINVVYSCSALHGRGIRELLEAVETKISDAPTEPSAPENLLKIAILGKPNVGKSSFLNALLKEQRMVVDERPGTTRDAVDVVVEWKGQRVMLTDTAGIRRSKKWESAPEFYSVSRARASVVRCDVVILIVDAMEGLSQQDRKLAQEVEEAGRGMVICLNKWDLAGEVDMRAFAEAFFRQIPFAAHIPLVCTSALKNQNVERCLEAAQKVFAESCKSVPTKKVNTLMERLQEHQSHPIVKGKHIKIYFAAQTGTRPPQFTLFVSDKDRVQESYLHYVKAQIRKSFGFEGVPIRFVLKNRR